MGQTTGHCSTNSTGTIKLASVQWNSLCYQLMNSKYESSRITLLEAFKIGKNVCCGHDDKLCGLFCSLSFKAGLTRGGQSPIHKVLLANFSNFRDLL